MPAKTRTAEQLSEYFALYEKARSQATVSADHSMVEQELLDNLAKLIELDL